MAIKVGVIHERCWLLCNMLQGHCKCKNVVQGCCDTVSTRQSGPLVRCEHAIVGKGALLKPTVLMVGNVGRKLHLHVCPPEASPRILSMTRDSVIGHPKAVVLW